MKKVTKRQAILGILSVLLVVLLVAVACGEESTPTPRPATATSVPPTATPAPTPQPTATPVPVAKLRPRSEWTADNPATFEEIEAELEKHRGETLNIVSWGGAYQAAQRQAYFVPFQEKFGIALVEDSPVEYAKIRAMAASGNVTWDVVDSGTRAVYQLGPTGDLEELSPEIHGGYLDDLPEVTRTPWSGGGGVLWSTGLAYSLNSFPNHQGAPKSWVDFWDVQKIPGKRSMGDRVNENIFFAQMALHPEVLDTREGRAALARLTPEQVDESFAKLEEIKPNIAVWWHGGTDCPQFLLSGELDMCTAWNGRIWNAQQEPGGEVLYYCYECGHLNQTDVFYIPKGSPHKELAELFIAWTAKPEINVEMSKYITYGPMNLKAIALLEQTVSKEIVDALPTSPAALEKVVIVDEVWLGTNLDKLAERFQAFLQAQ